MRVKLRDLFPREHGFYVMAVLPAAVGVALNWRQAAASSIAALSWVLLVLSSTGVKTWFLQPAKRVEIAAPLTAIWLLGGVGFLIAGVPLALLLASGIGLGSLALHFFLSDPKDRRSLGFEAVAAFILGFGMLVSGSAKRVMIPLEITQAALVYTLVQIAATAHVRLWIEALGGYGSGRRLELLTTSLVVHAALIGMAGVLVYLGGLPFYSLIPGLGEGVVVLATLPWFGRKVSFPKLGIAQTVGLAITATGLAIQFYR